MPNLTRLRRPSPRIRFPEDVARLRAIFAERGYATSDQDIQDAWEWVSEAEYGDQSQWVGIPDNDEAFEGLMKYLVPEGD